MPVGVANGDTDFGTVNKTGGAKSVTLTTAQIPAHSHTLSEFDTTLGPSLMGSGSVPAWAMNTNKSKNTSSTGSGSAHTNLQPYITCYFWRRTA